MAIRRIDYTDDAVAAARSVLLELTRLLGEYRDDIVIIGGWVPELLLSRGDAPHIGSMDVDLALAPLTAGSWLSNYSGTVTLQRVPPGRTAFYLSSNS